MDQTPDFMEKLKALLVNSGGAAGNDDREADAANAVDTTPTDSTDTAKGYDDGGPVTPDSSDPGYAAKLEAVLQAMGMGAKAAIAPLMPSINAPTTPVPAALNPTGSIQAPIPPSPTPSSEDAPDLAAGTPNSGAPSPAPAPVANVPKPPVAVPATQTPPAADLLNKITDGDGAKMQALLAQLQDNDKKSKFANALAIIGDTLGNVGNARAGMTPQGFTSTKLVGDIADANRKKSLDMIGQQLASDPNSQTSQLAQMTLIQSMGLQPNDPRIAKIKTMPAMTITQLVPQMTDAVKNNIEKERNLIQAKQLDQAHKEKQQEIAVSEVNSQREAKTAQTNAANDALKNVGVTNDLFSSGPSVRAAAKNTLMQNLGGQQSNVITATNSMGHKIQSADGGRTWHPIQ